MITEAFDEIFKKYAETAQENAMHLPAPTGEATQPPPEIVKYIATFMTKKAKGKAIKYDQSLSEYTKDDVNALTYGEGDNFKWDSLISLIKVGEKHLALITGMTSDGRQGSSSEVVGDAGLDAQSVISLLKSQGVAYPFLDPGVTLHFQELGLGDANFVDVSDNEGNKDPNKSGAFSGRRLLSFFANGVPEALKLPEFKSKYDNDGYRLVDLRNKMLHKVSGAEDPAATHALQKAKKNEAKMGTPEGAFKPLGVQDKENRFAAESTVEIIAKDNEGPLSVRNIQQVNTELKKTKDQLDDIGEAIGVSAKAASVRDLVPSLLLKVSGL